MIHEGVVWCVRHLPERKKKQYVVVMDNYFTMSKTMIGTRKCGVAAMGTARGRPGWPPKEIGKKSIQDKRYNSLYYMNDKVGNYRIFRWIDNNIVKMVSNVHTGGPTEQVLRNRRKPRLNEFNKKHVKLIWGDQHRKQLEIPQIINDYNHWMLGVDVVDQLIAYYRPKIRCRRTWVPIFLHCLDILRVNSYVLYKETSYNHPNFDNKRTKENHKHFLIEFVNSLIRRGNAETTCLPVITTRGVATLGNDPSIVHKGTTGKIVMSRSKPSLSVFDESRYCAGEHKMIPATQAKCKYCQYLVLVAKVRKEAPPIEQRPRLKCSICDVHLCKNHVEVFHRK